MSIKDKLIASGMDAAEAERIAALIGEGDEDETDEEKPGEEKPDEAKTGEAKPGEAKPDESKPGEEKPDETKPNESKPNESKPGEEKPDETKPNESKPGETQPGETKSDDSAARIEALTRQLIASEVRGCGLAAGVKAERLPTLTKLVELGNIDPSAENLNELVTEAVKLALQEVPELADGMGTGTIGNHMRNPGSPMSAFERGLLG